MTQEEFNKWADKACRYCYDKAISNEINLNFYAFQSKPLIGKQAKLLILGLNPHGDDGYWNGKLRPPYGEAISRFSEGNSHFHERDTWKLWQGLKRVFKKGNMEYMLEDDSLYMFMNVLYFNTNNIQTFKNQYDRDGSVFRESVNLTAEFIQLLKPERILCLSIGDCFNRLKDKFSDCRTLIPSFLTFGLWGDIPVYGIRHTSLPNNGETLTGKSLSYLFDRDRQQAVSTEEFKQVFAEDIELFKQHKPNFNRQEIIDIASATENLIKEKFGLTAHPEKGETVYTENKKLYITVTRTGVGYVAIRHSDYRGQQYRYEKQEELTELLSKYGYKKADVWLGQKPFIDYDTDDVPRAIAAEMEELLPLIDEIMKQ